MRRYSIGTAFLVALALAVLVGCTEKPLEPAFDNPLDPAGPDGGDPLQIQAVYLNGNVLVTWKLLGIPSVASYTVLHKLTPDGANTIAGEVDNKTNSFAHKEFLPNKANYYMVVAMDAEGNNTAASKIAQATIVPPPTLTIGDTTFVFTRQVDLHIRTAIGEGVQIDSLKTFDSPALMDFDLLDDDDTDDLITMSTTWADLGIAERVNQWKHLYMRVTTGGLVSTIEHDSVKTAFDPTMRLPFGGDKVGDETPEILIGGDGIEGMRFAIDPELLDGDFLDYAESAIGPLLADTLGTQKIYGEFLSCFGFRDTTTLTVKPDSLNTVIVTLNGGNAITSAESFNINANMGATHMRYAQENFVDEQWGWLEFEPNHSFTIADPCATGPTIVVFSQFKNDWGISTVAQDTVTWSPPEVLQIFFDIPDTLSGGQAVTLSGTATAGYCTGDLTAIKLYVDNTWYTADGLESWQWDWVTPVVTEPTTVNINGIAEAGVHEAGGMKTVVVVP